MQQTIETVRKSITVSRPPEEAFHVFTHRIGTWWPVKTHSVGQDRAEEAVLETRLGGRLYERAADGVETDWGHVLVWEPPERLVLSWHPGRAPETAQELELRFAPEGAGTRVELEHRGWERLGARAEEARKSYDGGWEETLELYARAVDG